MSPVKSKKKKGRGKKGVKEEQNGKEPDIKVQKKEEPKKKDGSPSKNVKEKKKKQESKDDIDSVLDDWLNGGDNEIPDELPDIDVSKEKKDVKSLKTKKANEILHNMNKLSGIMDDGSNTKIQNSVENFFGGNKGSKKSSKKKEETPKIVEIDQEKKEGTPKKLQTENKSDSKAKKEKENKIVNSKQKQDSEIAAQQSPDDIDSLLDDWLNGGDEDIPEELPDIDSKKDKKDVQNLKTKKVNEMFSNMNKLSGIQEDRTDTKIHSPLESSASAGVGVGGSSKAVTEYDKKTSEPVVTASKAPVEVKEPEVPVGDCAVCNNIAKAICTGCKNVFYCTRGCQKKHWASHKEDCKSLVKLPYRVSQNIMKEEFIPFFRKMFLYSHV